MSSDKKDNTKAAPKKAAQDKTIKHVLEADRIKAKDALLESLIILAQHYGRRVSANALMAGLPIGKDGIGPIMLQRIATRANLNARLAQKALKTIVRLGHYPCIVQLADDQAAVLWDVKKNEQGKVVCTVQLPETPDEKREILFSELQKVYAGHAYFVRPVAKVDDRAGPATIDEKRDWFWSALKDNMDVYRDVVIAAIMINLFALASPLFIMNVYDRVIPNAAYASLWVLAAGVSIAFIFDLVLKNLRARFLDIAGRRADVKISARIFEHIMGMSMKDRPASAGILAAHVKDFESLRDFFTSATMVSLIDVPFVLMFIILILVIGGPIAFVPFVAAIIVFSLGYIMQRPLRKIVAKSMHENALKNALLFEVVTGLETIKMQAAEGHMQRRWEELCDKASQTGVESRSISAHTLNTAMFVQQMASIVVVIVGTYLIGGGALTMGALIACVILTGRALAPLSQIAGLITRYNQSREALVQLEDLMAKPVERPYGKNYISKPTVQGHIELREVNFTYPGQSHPALQNLTLDIKPGDRVGVIGAVGSGKTTIERLLINLYEPESGSILIDGTDVRQIDPGDLRRSIGSVQQSPQLFFGSVRDNITMGNETVPEAAILKAAEMSGVMDFLRDSQLGIDTQVGERGEALSGGQRQAVAIARALLYDPSVLVLDEPTASMDPGSENRLKKRLQVITPNKTTILITHKGTMLTLVDKILLIDKGRMVDFGPRDAIIKKLEARAYGTATENTNV